MNELLTKISDYLSERRNDPERRENRLSVVIIGAVAVIVIILLLLVFWAHVARERREREEAAEAAAEAERADWEEEQLVAETFEEEAEKYMAPNDGQELLRKEYLESIQ